MIEVRSVVKTFDGFAALDGATLTVPKGAIYGLVGPNNASSPPDRRLPSGQRRDHL